MKILRYETVLNPLENVKIQRMFCPGGEGRSHLHTHEFIEIVYCSDGSGVQFVDGKEYEMDRGSLLFLNYGQSHSFRSDSGMHYYDFILIPSFLSESLIDSMDALALLALAAFSDFQGISDPHPILRFSGADMLEIEDIAARMEREFNRKQAGYRTILYGYMTVIFSKIFRKMAALDGTDARNPIAPGIMRYIEEHLGERITLAELAQKSYYNPSYFSRVFKELAGQSLTDYIHRKRVEWAVELLKTTSKTAEQIGAAVGYGDKKQFYRQFKKYTGMTPGEARSGS